MFDTDDKKLFDIVYKFMLQKDVLDFDEYLYFLNGLNLNEFYVSDLWHSLSFEIEDELFDKFSTSYDKEKGTSFIITHGENATETLYSVSIDAYENKLNTLIEFNGGEGQGDSAEIIMRHNPSGRFVSLSGSYSSYEGFYWYDDWVEVFPVEVVRTEYVSEKPCTKKTVVPPMPLL